MTTSISQLADSSTGMTLHWLEDKKKKRQVNANLMIIKNKQTKITKQKISDKLFKHHVCTSGNWSKIHEEGVTAGDDFCKESSH